MMHLSTCNPWVDEPPISKSSTPGTQVPIATTHKPIPLVSDRDIACRLRPNGAQQLQACLLVPLLMLLLVLLSGSTSRAFGQLAVPSLFSDNMVLQRNDTVRIWGRSSDPVRIAASWLAEPLETTPGSKGQWRIQLPTTDAGGPHTITLTTLAQKDETSLQASTNGQEQLVITNVLLGDVWLCGGQSNMEMPLRGYLGEPVSNSNEEVLTSENSNIRWISVPRKSTTEKQTNFEGKWKQAGIATTGSFSAVAYYFAKRIQQITGVPIGLVEVTYGGSIVEAWMNKPSLAPFPEIETPANNDEIGEPNRTATALYNGMLAPVIGYTIKGAIWYQGESNARRPLAYQQLFPAMVQLWREEWQQEAFPFYYVQIAPYHYDTFYPAEDLPWFANSAFLRDAQRQAQYLIPNAAMACVLDAGDQQTIHPADKQTPGERLAWLALQNTYGYDGFGAATPDYDQLNMEDSLVTITFKNLPNGLTSKGKTVTAFEIAGQDRVFHPATCNVRRKSVQVWSDKVKQPVAVRYAFTNTGPAQLFSTEGIPITSFRTDNWNPEPK